VLLDNGGIHRGEPVQDLLGRTSRLHLEPFPPYAPELNPDEGVWNHLKAHLATGVDLFDDLHRVACLGYSLRLI
jgi:transposase